MRRRAAAMGALPRFGFIRINMSISKSERLLNLVSCLLKARRPVGFPEIRNSVTGYMKAEGPRDTVERRFERDKATLREMGIPLEFREREDEVAAGYVIPRDEYFLPRMELTSAETAILSAAGRFAMTGAVGPVSDALQSALRKLQFDSPFPGGIRETSEEQFLFWRHEAPQAEHADNLRELTSAVLNNRTVTFRYYAIGHNEVERRTLEPYGLGYADGHWYLVGNDLDRHGVRVFRVDRIRGEADRLHPDITKAEFDVPSDFRIQDHIGLPPWLFGNAKPVIVRMRFDADVAFMVRLRPAPGDAWEEHPDGAMTLTRKATHLDALLSWTLGFGRRVKVLGPPEFRRRVDDTFRQVAAMHSRKPTEAGR